jgi:hypothetical protein
MAISTSTTLKIDSVHCSSSGDTLNLQDQQQQQEQQQEQGQRSTHRQEQHEQRAPARAHSSSRSDSRTVHSKHPQEQEQQPRQQQQELKHDTLYIGVLELSKPHRTAKEYRGWRGRVRSVRSRAVATR